MMDKLNDKGQLQPHFANLVLTFHFGEMCYKNSENFAIKIRTP